jgi:hypothetical protein
MVEYTPPFRTVLAERRARAALLAAVVAVGVTAPQASWAQAAAAPQEARVEGEYGLWVTQSADSVRVAWLTRRNGAGFAEIRRDDGSDEEIRTAAGHAHAATFAQRASGSLRIRYGSRADRGDRHETIIRLLTPPRPSVEISGVDSLFVIGDIHGEFDTLIAVLRNARVVDGNNRWRAGRAHLAVLGDMVDRGPDATRVLWFLYGLEPQAQRAGGRIDVVLGNHEIMMMLADMRYVHPKEQAIAAAHGIRYDRMYDSRRSVLGRWLASRPALIRVDDVLLAHGGASTDWLGYTLQSYDDTLAAFVGEELFDRWVDTTYAPPVDSLAFKRRTDFFWDERSVFWYRGYAESAGTTAALDSVLAHFRARLHVVGHTPVPTIRGTHGGSFLDVNTTPFAAEMLLITRKGGALERWRYRTRGRPERL